MKTRDSERISIDLAADAQTLFMQQVTDPVVIQHVQEMNRLLTHWQVRTPVLIAAWLLVIVRNELVPDNELTARFGNRALQIARLACKLIFTDIASDTQRRGSPKVAYADLVRKLFVYAYGDVEAVLVIVADQIATASQYQEIPATRHHEWAQRNQEVFIPLLEMLGLWKHRSELGNLSLYILNPTLYQQLENQIKSYQERHQQLYEVIAPDLKALLEEQNIQNVALRLHITTPSSLYKRIEKLRKRGDQPKSEEISSLCVDVLVENPVECYLALGVIHNHWRPALRQTNLAALDNLNESRFRDFIAVPRYNGYRCLITTVLTELPGSESKQQLVEFRIRTYQMEAVNTFGITAAVLDPTPIRHAWWVNQTVRDMVKPGTTDFLKNTPEISVFTPGGEVIHPLHSGSTMLDLAFKIHSSLGVYAKAFWANGKPVPLDYQLRHRDLVEVEYDLHYPAIQPEWEEIAHLQSTKASIRRFLRLRDRVPHRGRRLINEVLEREAEIYRMRFQPEKIEASLSRIARDYGCANVEALYIKVLEGTIAPDEIVAAMIEAELVGHIGLANGEDIPARRIRIAQTWMQEKEAHKWDRNSRVLPGTEIVGKWSGHDNNRVLTVYRKDARQLPPVEQQVELRWRSSKDLHEAVELTVTAPPRSHIIGMVFNAIYGIGKDNDKQRITVHRFNADTQENQLIINALIDTPSATSIQMLQDALRVIQRSGYITDFKIWQLFPGHKLLIAGKSDKRQQNPYTLKQVGNRSMFYGRQLEIKTIIENIEEGHLVVLYGQKRIGKTSLLNQLADLLPQTCDVLPVLFDAHSLSPFDAVSFLSSLAEAAQERILLKLKRPEERKKIKFQRRNFQADPMKAFAEWVKSVQQHLQGTRLVFMVDEFTRAEEECQRGAIDTAFFDGLQWLTGNQNISFVLCVHDHLILKEGNKSWGLLQRGKPLRLDALDRVSAERLVQQPLENLYKIEPALVNRILQLTNCHPYLIQVICHTLITYMAQSEQNQVTATELEWAVREVLQNGDHYFSHFRSRVTNHDWDVLKVIASLCELDSDLWANSDDIRSTMRRLDYKTEGWKISRSIGDLKHAGLIEARDDSHQAAYRIPIGLFQMWLKQVVTSLLVSRDIQRED